MLATEGARRRPAVRQQAEICFAHLEGSFGLGETLAKTLVGLAIRIAAKVTGVASVSWTGSIYATATPSIVASS